MAITTVKQGTFGAGMRNFMLDDLPNVEAASLEIDFRINAMFVKSTDDQLRQMAEKLAEGDSEAYCVGIPGRWKEIIELLAIPTVLGELQRRQRVRLLEADAQNKPGGEQTTAGES